MANKKITDLSAASVPLAGTELFEVVQAGVSLKVAASDIAASFSTDAANILPVINGGSGVATLTGYVKGNGTADFTAAATVPFGDMSGRAYGSFLSTQDQNSSTSTAVAITVNTSGSFNAGVSVASNSRITMAAAGIYQFTINVQLKNTDSSNQTATIWYAINGTNVANSATTIGVHKTGDTGLAFFEITSIEQFTAAQYVEFYFISSNTAVTLDYVAASAGPPSVPAIPSVIINVNRIG
jgi:hypothetical protein